MRTVGNFFWIIFGGLELFLAWGVIGLVLCCTIVGIPLGLQAFKMAKLSLAPFGLHVDWTPSPSSVLNIVWVIFVGWYMALGYLIIGLAWCCTIVGIPIGLQVMKMAKLAFWPFGSQILTY